MRRFDALTMGTFDPLHEGHLGLFRQCRNLIGDHGELVVAVNSDEFVKSYRGTAPLMPHTTRVQIIDALDTVTHAVLNESHSLQSALIAEIHPRFLVIGDDWAQKDYLSQIGVTKDWLEDRNIQLVYVPRTGDWSSTRLKTRLAVG